MALQKYTKGTTPFHTGQPLEHLYIIAGGSMEAVFSDFTFSMQKGDVVGLADIAFDTCSCDYVVSQDVSLIPYPYESPDSLTDLFQTTKDLSSMIMSSAVRLISEISDHYVLSRFHCDNFYEYIISKNDEYKQLCVHFGISPKNLPGMEELAPLSLEEDVPSWLSSYYDAVSASIPSLKDAFSGNSWLTTGFLLKASEDLHRILDVCRHMSDYLTDSGYLLLNENRLDFFDLFTDLYFRAYRDGEDTIPLGALISKLFIQIEGTASISRELYRQRVTQYRAKVQMMEQTPPAAQPDNAPVHSAALTDSLRAILTYGDCGETLSREFTDALQSYKKLLDKNAQDDPARALRLHITKQFYEIYKNVFLISLSDRELPPVIRMFLNFGYMDEELAGCENAAYLYSIADSWHGDASVGVYTLYEWLSRIYRGEKAPSRNEFDADYEAFVREQRVTGKIPPEAEQHMLNDNAQKVLFELDNMFPLVNKVTFGRISSFCPVFSEHNVLKDLESSLVTPNVIVQCMTKLRALDYAAFYRETVYTNPECGIAKEYVQTEILPDIILMPNIGTRGITWQEIEGRRRATPARMMLSAFSLENPYQLLIRLTGEYRWEMCKRVQGARWNDVSDPSLTSEYCDYAQFYRKNHDLSSDAKEKIKNSLQKCKSSYKELFVQDYLTWILYEGGGSPRLNKVARSILFQYCPFTQPVRSRLKANPLYRELLERYDVRSKQQQHHMEILFQRLQKAGSAVPPELNVQYQFLCL